MSEASAGAACNVCGCDLEAGAPEVRCPRCDTPVHPECWQYAEGCSVYGCHAALELAEEKALARLEEEPGALPAPPSLPALPGRWLRGTAYLLSHLPRELWRVLGGLLVIVLLFVGLGSPHLSRLGVLGVFSGVALGSLLFGLAAALPNLLLRLSWGAREPAELEETPLKQLEARLAEAPDSVPLLELLAMGRFAERDFEGARELYTRALAIHPDDLRMQLQVARTFHMQGEEAEARSWYHRVAGSERAGQAVERARWWLEVMDRRQAPGAPPQDPGGAREVGS